MASNWQNIIVQEGQSLYDIALQHYGNAEAIIDLVRDNNLNGVTDILQAGQVLKINTASDKYNKAIVSYYNAHNIVPATQSGTNNNPKEEILPLNIIAYYPQYFVYNSNDHTYVNTVWINALYIYADYNRCKILKIEFTSDAEFDFELIISCKKNIEIIYYDCIWGKSYNNIIDITNIDIDYITIEIVYNPVPLTGTIKIIKLA